MENLEIHIKTCFNKEWQLATYKELVMTNPKISKDVKPRSKNREQPSRLNFRLAPEVKARVARAAALAGQDLTEFAVAALQEKADETIQKHESLFLSAADYEFFLNALDSGEDKELSEKSIRAAERYRQGTRKGVRYSLAD